MKICTVCSKLKPLEDYYKDGKYRRSECKPCRLESLKTPEKRLKNNERMRESYPANRETRLKARADWGAKNRRHLKNYELTSHYGITIEQYEAMVADQSGKCAICPRMPGGKRSLVVDHDHNTGKVRGLLCYNCNRSVALIDDPERHEKSIKYVNKYKEAA